MRLPRITIRSLMALILLVAIALAGYAAILRSRHCEERSQHYTAQARVKRGFTAFQEMVAKNYRRQSEISGERARTDQSESGRANALKAVQFWDEQVEKVVAEGNAASDEAARLDALAASYARAARYPWLPLPKGPK